VNGHSRTRPVVVVLALVGCGVATGLTLFQVGVLDSVWEPFFGDGSRRVLTSALSRALPVPDAALGATAYLVEAVLTALGRPDRPKVVLASAAVAGGLGLAALGLLAAQVFLVGAFCTLCLVSAALSLAIAGLVLPAARPAVERVRSRAG
jgi:Vitamin K epoxide reductase family